MFLSPQGKPTDCWTVFPPQGRYGRKLYKGFENKDRAALLASLSNDFEDVLFKAEPVLGETFSYLSSLCKKR